MTAQRDPTDAHHLDRAAFDRGRAFGLQLARRQGGPLSVRSLMRLLSDSSLPCLNGVWEPCGSSAWQLRRSGCDSICARQCDDWREAIDGLVMGAGDRARYARHLSRGHGDPACLDVLYEAGEDDLRWGPVPDTFRAALEPLSARLASSDITLHLDGYAEGVLFYRLDSGGASPCGTGGTLLRGVLEREVSARLPGIRPLDVTPVGVLREG